MFCLEDISTGISEMLNSQNIMPCSMTKEKHIDKQKKKKNNDQQTGQNKIEKQTKKTQSK